MYFEECGCYCEGTIDQSKICDDQGKCDCNREQGYIGDKCDQCNVGFYIEAENLKLSCKGI